MNDILKKLNAPTAEDRLNALRELISRETESPAMSDKYANNHIHTFYSFSPYSPTAAVYFARAATLTTAGIMDHDSIAGAREFIEAGKIAGVDTTVGLECRVSLSGTALESRRVNNPDQSGVAYMALHGVPHGQIDTLQQVFEPLRLRRNERNRKMTDNINSLLSEFDILLDFDADVLPLSKFDEGGSVTERHLIDALCKKIIAVAGLNVAAFVENRMKIPLSEKQKNQLSDSGNPYLEYDLLGLLKAQFVEKIYVPATDECLHISQLSDLAKQTGALFCYAYLGDVGNSVTGDKKAQKFEDDFLDELFATLVSFGIDAVTYMPSRNTPEQLSTIQKMCRERSILEISGEDINSPRQSFICKQLEQPQFRHLIDATHALIERERRLSE